jgi:hypothetical protein
MSATLTLFPLLGRTSPWRWPKDLMATCRGTHVRTSWPSRQGEAARAPTEQLTGPKEEIRMPPEQPLVLAVPGCVACRRMRGSVGGVKMAAIPMQPLGVPSRRACLPVDPVASGSTVVK